MKTELEKEIDAINAVSIRLYKRMTQKPTRFRFYALQKAEEVKFWLRAELHNGTR